MSDFYGANNTLLRNVPEEKIAAQSGGGVLRVLSDSYTFSAIIDTTDTLHMMKIPKGAKIYQVEISADDLGTTGDFNIGWAASEDGVEAADADGFFAALDVNAAAITNSTMVRSVAGFEKTFAAEVELVIVPSEITTATSGSVSVKITYAIN